MFITATTLVASVPSKSHPADRFKEFKNKHKKNYGKDEELVRLALFTLVDQDIENHNKNPSKTYEKGHSHFSDWTDEEKKSLTGDLAASPSSASDRYGDEIEERVFPTSLNLVTSTSCVGPIKNQGQCGSCFAFSAISTLEYSYCKLHGNVYVSLSEQQDVDCDTVQAAKFGAQYGGCNGGSYNYVWQYLSATGGSESTSAYGAYTSGTTGARSTCKFNSTGVVAKVAGTSFVYTNPTNMIAALNNQGVLSVSLYVTSNFQAYRSGIFSSDPLCPACPSQGSCPTNHAVNLVGYGTQNGIDFWIVRNSWGAGWGEAGYIRMKRGINLCNLENKMAYVVAQI